MLRNYKTFFVQSLREYHSNSRTHSDSQIDQVAHSINEFGFTAPILIDEDNVVIAGHCRLKAAKKLGLTQVPCLVLEGLTELQKKAYVIADNKLTLNADWDFGILKAEFEALEEANFDLDLTGFSLDEIASLFTPPEMDGLCDENDIPTTPDETICKNGDVWLLGNHRLICGDSTNPQTVDKLFDSAQPNLMVTDPPYGVNYDPDWRNNESLGVGRNSVGKVQNDDLVDWSDTYSLFTGNVCYVWHAGKYTHIVAKNLEDCGFEIVSQIIWAKNNFAISRGDYHWKHEPCWYVVRKGEKHSYNGARDQSTLWEINNTHQKEENEKVGHGTQKPVECMLRPILNNSLPNEYVYDPFGGSGTTLIACEKSGRKCLMIELDEKYCDIIIARWEKFSGKKARREFFDARSNTA